MLPFMLRRMKEDVLADLPPKIIQDVYCELSPLQAWLYEDFSKRQLQSIKQEVEADDDLPMTSDDMLDDVSAGKPVHVFQALQYLRKVCNHPLLVLSPKHPQYQRLMRDDAAWASVMSCSSELSGEAVPSNASRTQLLHSVVVAPKLLALQQILYSCEIGIPESKGNYSIVFFVVALCSSMPNECRLDIAPPRPCLLPAQGDGRHHRIGLAQAYGRQRLVPAHRRLRARPRASAYCGQIQQRPVDWRGRPFYFMLFIFIFMEYCLSCC